MTATLQFPINLVSPDTADAMDKLLRSQGCGSGARLTAMRGGANNRSFRADCDGLTFFLKEYFRDSADSRDRLAAEFAFAHLAWDNGIRSVPRPLAKDDVAGLGLYEFVHGRRLERGEVNVTHVEQALTFVRRLGTLRFAPAASGIAAASEACFTLEDHARLVARRVDGLANLQAASAIDREAAMFVTNELTSAWQAQLDRLHRRAESLGLPLDQPLEQRDLCLSPSDFGFHNAVLEGGGRLRFIDFEYAGWDDPAKLVCDFFCQPAVPVPRQFLDAVASAVVESLPNRGAHRQRIDLLWPIYRVKWCCIMLNVFNPVSARRRAFASNADEVESAKKTQLALSRQALRSLMESAND